MNSNSEISTVRPPVSMLLVRTASPISDNVTPWARIRAGSTTIEYCLTKPPTLATSETPSALEAAKRTTQSCSDRSSASESSLATTAYW
jgi:hypothetical protein